MFRKALTGMLQNHAMALADIADELDMTVKEVEDDLHHLQKSLKHSDLRLHVIPACCKKCNFVFSREKLRKPGKCPRCHGTWIQAPLVEITKKD